MHMTKKLAFKNNAPFVSCISKNNNTLTDNAEDLDIVMLMYNLLESSKNYSKTTESFCITTKMNQIAVQAVQITTLTIELSIQNLLITKQVLQESQKVTTQQNMLKLFCH